MEPEVVFLADVGDLVDGIESAEDGGAGRGVDEERDFPIGDGLLYEAFQLGRDHFTPLNSIQLLEAKIKLKYIY